MEKTKTKDRDDSSKKSRREILKRAPMWAMLGGLVAGYGTFAAFAGRFLYPRSGSKDQWMFVATLQGFDVGHSKIYITPAGNSIVVARQAAPGEAASFVALSTVCPHLGCQVHWEGTHNRFFCPCHNGTFDASGVATGGPPAGANQSLSRYELAVRKGLLYLAVPSSQLAQGGGNRLEERCDIDGPPGPGHDPCLFRCSNTREV